MQNKASSFSRRNFQAKEAKTHSWLWQQGLIWYDDDSIFCNEILEIRILLCVMSTWISYGSADNMLSFNAFNHLRMFVHAELYVGHWVMIWQPVIGTASLRAGLTWEVMQFTQRKDRTSPTTQNTWLMAGTESHSTQNRGEDQWGLLTSLMRPGWQKLAAFRQGQKWP